MHCDVEGSVWGSAENQSGVSWNRLHSVFPWYLQHQQPPGRTAEGRRLHNSVVQRGRRGQVMRVKTWGGSEFLPHQRCFGMKRKHGLLPDHIAFSAASTHPDRMRSAPKLVGCQTLVVSLSSRHHGVFKRCFYLVETKCTVDVCAAPCGSWGMSLLFWSKDMQTVQYKRSGSWNGKFPRSLVCSCLWPLLLGGRGVFSVRQALAELQSDDVCFGLFLL